jgi:hypothetical protein
MRMRKKKKMRIEVKMEWKSGKSGKSGEKKV